jgi:uncharacterized protein YozE (UPF0346 family)
MMQKRYYLHGDLYELIPNQYYCALCDSFEYKEHFHLDDFHKVNNQEKYIGSLEIYKKANKKFLKYNLRPSNSENLFSDIPPQKKGNFYNWLKKQKDRDDPIGDLANDSLSDKSFPTESDSLEKIKTHLIVKNACDEAIQALKEAFDEFNSNRKYRSGISLKLRFEIFRNDDYRCQICGASAKDDGVKLELDHRIPKSKGGSDDKSNLWTLCFNCNRGKGKSKL